MSALLKGKEGLAAASSRLFSVVSSAAAGSHPLRLLQSPSFASTMTSCASPPSKQGIREMDVLSPVPSWNVNRRHMWHTAANYVRSAKYRVGLENPVENPARKNIVFLGTGWGAIRFIPDIDTTKYKMTIISPRNYFVFTPLLPSVCTGGISSRSAMEPIRRFLQRGGKKVMTYYDAKADNVSFDKDTVHVKAIDGQQFEVPYDYLILGVGCEPNTFGIPGVKENAFYLKEAEHALDIRQKVFSNFEKSSLPTTTEAEKRRLLHFVCVGGGPSGVETAAELTDLIHEDIIHLYPDLVQYAQVSVVEMLPRMLPSFTEEASEFTFRTFKKSKINPLVNSRVTKMTPHSIHIVNAQGKEEDIPCGFVLWASGIAQVPLSQSIMAKIPAQQNNRPAVINVDQNLRVKGVAHKNVFALGDCSYLVPRKLADNADQLFEKAKACGSGAGTTFLKSTKELMYRFPQLSPSKNVAKDKNNLKKEEFLELLKEIDAGYKPPIPTAQNAGQEGVWLACMLNDFDPIKDEEKLPSFVENFKGSLAYVGRGEAIALTKWFNIIGGFHSSPLWKTVYWSLQMSLHNRMLLLTDWVRIKFAGRDVNHLRNHEFFGRRPPMFTTTPK